MDEVVNAAADEHTPLLVNTNVNASPMHLAKSPVGGFTKWLISDPLFLECCISQHSILGRLIKGAGLTTSVFWPIVFYGSMIHDLVLYFAQPRNRYDNSLEKIFAGWPRNEKTLTTMLGSIDASEWQYFVWPGLLLASLFITAPTGFIGLSDHVAHEKFPHETLQDLRTNAPIYRRFYANYLQWARGYKTNIRNIGVAGLTHLVFWSFNLLIYYADARIIEIFINKFIAYINSKKVTNDCSSKQMVHQFMDEFGEYVCGVCPDWPFVYMGDVFTSQGCIDGLLAQSQAPEVIVSGIKQLHARAKPYFSTVDLSQQNWNNWTTPQWQSVLNQISSMVQSLDLFNLTNTNQNQLPVEVDKYEILVEFINDVTVSKFDLHGQRLGSILFTNTTSILNFKGMTYLDLSSTSLDNDAFNMIASNVDATSLQTFKVSNNAISDSGLSEAVAFVSNSSIISFDISYNLLTSNSVSTLVAFASQGQMNELNVAGNDFSNANFAPFWSATTSHNILITIHLAQCNINDEQIAAAAPYLANSSIKNWGLQNNQFSDLGAIIFFTGLANSTVVKVDISGNAITDVSIAAISNVLPDTELDILGLSDCSYSTTGLAQLAQSLWNSTVDTLICSGNFLGDDGAIIMANALLHKNNLIRFLDMSGNQITDIGGKALAASIKGLEALILNNNLLTSATASSIAPQLPGSSLRILGLNQNRINATGANSLANNLPYSALTEIDLGNNPLSDGVTSFAESLIQPIVNENELSNSEISPDLARNLNNNGHRNTSLTFFNIANTNMAASDARVICRVLHPANISINNAILAPNNNINPSQVNLINCRINQNANSFFYSPAITSSTMQSRAALFSAANIGSTFLFSITSGIVAASAIIGLVALMYVIYRAINRNNQADDQQNLRRTDNARNSN
jgi:Ran GTPase-activating protein (RanGAP) involved in mRNA processing and transport